MTRSTLALLAALAGLGGAAVPGALAQNVAAQGDARWLPWVGCWEGATEVGAPATDRVLVCFRPLPSGDGVEILTYSDTGELVAVEDLTPNGVPVPAEEGGCVGQRVASWSDDGLRVFLSSSLDCGTPPDRTTRGVLTVLPGGAGWIEIQSARVEAGNPVLGIRTFVGASGETLAGLGIVDPSAGLDLAVSTARTRAGRALTADALVEIVEGAGPEVASALIVERGQRVGLNASLLRSLSERGVPGDVLDVMVAVSYPDRFQLGGSPEGPLPEIRDVVDSAPAARRAVSSWPLRSRPSRGYSPWRFGYYDPFFFDPFFYGTYEYGYSPYGYRSFGSPYYQVPRVIVVTPPVIEDRNDFYLDPDRGLVRRGSGSTGTAGSASDSRAPSARVSRPSASSGRALRPSGSGSRSSGGNARVSGGGSRASGGGVRTSPRDSGSSGGSASPPIRRAVPRSGDGGNP